METHGKFLSFDSVSGSTPNPGSGGGQGGNDKYDGTMILYHNDSRSETTVNKISKDAAISLNTNKVDISDLRLGDNVTLLGDPAIKVTATR